MPLAVIKVGMNDESVRQIEKIRKKTIETVRYMRNQNVSKYVKIRAKGRCECCNNPSPFKNESDEPYLETHHLIPVSEGGLDSPTNIIAVCPNCHRRFHHSKEKEILTEKMRQIINHLEK